MSENKTLSISAVAEKTGLSTHVIRAWERRYGAVKPERSDGNQRLYSEADVVRLQLLRRAVAAGHSLQEIAGRGAAELGRLLGEDDLEPSTQIKGDLPPDTIAFYFGHCMRAVQSLDPKALDATLTQASVVLDRATLVEELMMPLLDRVGRLWVEGELGIAHEHAATVIIRTFLANLTKHYDLPFGAPTILVTTPAGQTHELGAMFCAALAAARRWRVYYLGPDMPAAQVAQAAQHATARAVAVSIVYPEDDPRTAGELLALRAELDEAIDIVAGGRAAHSYADTLDAIGAIQPDDAHDFYRCLDRLESEG
jgi:methanogenic corrinoid protein MtbC1